jgi:hypothetical protein
MTPNPQAVPDEHKAVLRLAQSLVIGMCAIWRAGCVSLTHQKSLCYGQPLSIRTVSKGFPLWRLKKI